MNPEKEALRSVKVLEKKLRKAEQFAETLEDHIDQLRTLLAVAQGLQRGKLPNSRSDVSNHRGSERSEL